MAGDPLSDALSLMKPQGFMSGGIDAGGDWAISFGKDRCFRCFALLSGDCWLEMDQFSEPVLLSAGEFIALPHGSPFRLLSEPGIEPTDISSILRTALRGRVMQWNGGGSCLAVSALFTFAGDQAELLLGALPTLMRVQRPTDRIALRWYLERMMEVTREAQPGHILLGEHLAQMMLVELLRTHLEEIAETRTGWLFALADKQMAAALSAMHSEPGRRWTLASLASTVGMSRSALAVRFKERVGVSAMAYLIRWRMLLAADQLVNANQSVASIAASLGYESESAFGFAFKREMGCSPRQFCRHRLTTERTVL